jgi:hypothetical protein
MLWEASWATLKKQAASWQVKKKTRCIILITTCPENRLNKGKQINRHVQNLDSSTINTNVNKFQATF